MLSLAFIFESGQSVEWNPSFVASLLWLIFALSIGAILILYYLLARSSAAAVSSLYYLVPAVTAVEAYFLFGETISLITAIGAMITIIGVALVLRESKKVTESS
jgi:drug/metabolite transporter (DMT)-like permease